MATRCPLPADHGYLTHLDGSVTLTRPCEDMEPAALMDLKAALTLLGDRAVNLRVSQPRLWINMCSAMKVWLDRHECDRGALVLGDRRQWTAHREVVIKDTLGLCLAMRFTRRQWIRKHFYTLLRQYNVDTAVELASRIAMISTVPTSVVYLGFSFQTARPYIGMVQERDPWLRFAEHWASIANHQSGLSDPREAKYSYMASNGGVNRWHFLPLVVPSMVLSRRDLHRLERHIWSRYPARLNGMRPRGANSRSRVLPDNSPTSRRLHKARADAAGDVQVEPGHLSPVIAQVFGHDLCSRAVSPEPSLEQTLRSFPGATWHTSAPHALVVAKRVLGASVVIVREHKGGYFVGRLRAALKWTQQLPGSWVTLTFLQRHVKQLQRGEDYDFLLALARHEIPTSEAEDLLVE